MVGIPLLHHEFLSVLYEGGDYQPFSILDRKLHQVQGYRVKVLAGGTLHADRIPGSGRFILAETSDLEEKFEANEFECPERQCFTLTATCVCMCVCVYVSLPRITQ